MVLTAGETEVPTPLERHRSAQRTPVELLWALAGASAILAALAGTNSTGNAVADVFWAAVFGGSLSLVSADARRWSWFPLAGLAIGVAAGWFALACAVVAVGLTMWFGFGQSRRRWMGALIGLLAAQAIVRGRSYGFVGLPSLLAVAACLPAYISAFLNTSRPVRQAARVAMLIGGIVVGLLTLFTFVSATRARSSVLTAIDFGEQAVDATEKGDQRLASILIEEAGAELHSISSDFNQPWLAPARFLPVLGHYSSALRDMADAGGDVAASGADVLEVLDPETLLPAAGTVDLAEVDLLVPAVAELQQNIEAARRTIDDIDHTWLADSASDRIFVLADEMERLAAPVAQARSVTDVLPGLLGATGEQRYLVVFMTPAESRGLGGFPGNWAEIVVTNGVITVGEVGRSEDLNDGLPAGGIEVPVLEGRNGIDTMYDGFRLHEFFGNITAVPDFPWVAHTAAAFFEGATGRAVDAVIGMDVEAMSGLVSLSGPVQVDGRSLGPDALRDFVLVGQYVDYEGNEEGRVAALNQLTLAAFENLVGGALPTPFQLADVVGPLVDGDHLRIYAFDEAQQAGFDALDVSDPFPANQGQDLLAVVIQNVGENKIDTFLDKDIVYDAVVDPDTGEVRATLTVTLTNNALAEGLPDAIIGNNDQGYPLGTNVARIEFFSPLEFIGGELGDSGIALGWYQTLGWYGYTTQAVIPPGDRATLTVVLDGSVDVTAGYRLDVEHQPSAREGTVSVRVVSSDAGRPAISIGSAGDFATSVPLTSDQRLEYAFGGG